jgi:hypothetical protein
MLLIPSKTFPSQLCTSQHTEMSERMGSMPEATETLRLISISSSIFDE